MEFVKQIWLILLVNTVVISWVKFSSMICFNLAYIQCKNQNCNAIVACSKTGRKSKMISFSCVYRSSPCLPSNKCYGVTITVMSLSHSWQESLSNLLAFKNVYEHKKVAIFFFIFYHADTIICTFTGNEFTVFTKDNGHLIAFLVFGRW